MSLQLTQRGVRAPQAVDLERWRREFEAVHCIQVRGLLEPALLAWIRRRLAVARFVPRVHKGVVPPPTDLGLADEPLLAALFLLLNDARLFHIVRTVTGCDAIGCFQAVAYRKEPIPDHRDAWHDDDDGNRMVAMSINVGEPYEGGVLQIREAGSGRVLHDAVNTGPGDAILFRLAATLEHRVSPVTGRAPKTAVAGWFQRTPDALAMIRESARAD